MGGGGAGVVSGRDGRYERRVAAGDRFVSAGAPGHVRTFFPQAVSTDRDGTPGDGMTIPIRIRAGQIISGVDIRLDRSSAVSGRIVADVGVDLTDVQIELLRNLHGPGGIAPAALLFAQVERPDGTFRVTDVPAGEYYARAYTQEPIRSAQLGAASYAPTF